MVDYENMDQITVVISQIVTNVDNYIPVLSFITPTGTGYSTSSTAIAPTTETKQNSS